MRAWRLALTILVAVVLGMASLATVPLGVVHAEGRDLSVTNCTDFGASGQAGTLGDALAQAASNDGSTIKFACAGAGPFAFFVPVPQRPYNDILNTLTISNPARNVTLSGGGNHRLFIVESGGNLTLDGVPLDRGAVGSEQSGGAIINYGTLTVKNSTLSNNYADGARGSGTGRGGAIYSTGTLTIENSTLSNNTADGGTPNGKSFGGAVFSSGGVLQIIHSTFGGNTARGRGNGNGYGGAVYVENGVNVTITDSAFAGGYAVGGGGGVSAQMNPGGTLTITDSTFVSNSGSAVYKAGGALTITDSAFVSNTAYYDGYYYSGAGVYNIGGALTITESAFVGNTANRGGGVWSIDSALTITDSAFAGNWAGRAHYAAGGAVQSEISANAPTRITSITNSAFIGNAALGLNGQSSGGAVATSPGVELHITDSTFVANIAGLTQTSTDPMLAKAMNLLSAFEISASIGDIPIGKSGKTAGVGLGVNIGQLVGGILALAGVGQHNGSSGYGGAVYIGGTATITNSTVTANQTVGSSGPGGGIFSSPSTPSTTIMNSIVAGNSSDTAGTANCGGPIRDGGYNLTTWDGECGTTSEKHDVWTASPGLVGFDNNGGLTPTLALLGSSVAVDQIPRGTNGCGTDVKTDQRGIARPQGEKCDIGAFEVDRTPPVTTASISSPSSLFGWYTSDVKVALKAEDNTEGSGVNAIYYSVNQGAEHTYGAPFPLVENGQYVITYWSVDSMGNTEAAKTVTFAINKSAPGIFIGLAVAVLLILALVAAWVLWRRRRGGGGYESVGPGEETPTMGDGAAVIMGDRIPVASGPVPITVGRVPVASGGAAVRSDRPPIRRDGAPITVGRVPVASDGVAARSDGGTIRGDRVPVMSGAGFVRSDRVPDASDGAAVRSGRPPVMSGADLANQRTPAMSAGAPGVPQRAPRSLERRVLRVPGSVTQPPQRVDTTP